MYQFFFLLKVSFPLLAFYQQTRCAAFLTRFFHYNLHHSGVWKHSVFVFASYLNHVTGVWISTSQITVTGALVTEGRQFWSAVASKDSVEDTLRKWWTAMADDVTTAHSFGRKFQDWIVLTWNSHWRESFVFLVIHAQRHTSWGNCHRLSGGEGKQHLVHFVLPWTCFPWKVLSGTQMDLADLTQIRLTDGSHLRWADAQAHWDAWSPCVNRLWLWSRWRCRCG